MSTEIYQKNIMEDIRNGKPVPRCVVCGEGDPVVLEEHHTFARANSEKVVLLCKNCHSKITNEQNKVSPKSRSKDASYLEKMAYQLISIGALLKEVGNQLIKLGHELISYVHNCNTGLYSKN
jgi:hypothetical protein